MSRHLDMFNTAPFLFVGSGISIRYIGLENWEDLLKKFSDCCGQHSFDYYYTEANESYPKVAGLIANDFHGIWFESDRFEEDRVIYKEHLKKKDSPLKIEISKYLRNRSTDFVQKEHIQREIELMKNINIDGIITTNWDLLLENIFPDFQVFTGQQELLFSESQSIAEIYKIHGCCTKPNSLVLTDQDYELFNKRNPYLAAKLLTIFVEHPIIFMGYSIEDKNIKEILNNIGLCLTNENADKLKDRLIFVEWTEGRSEDQMSPREFVISDDDTSIIIPLTVVKVDDFSQIYEALSKIKRKFPAKFLRKIKDHIYELVRTNDPKNRLYVSGIEDDVDMSDIDVVLGVGIINDISDRGYEGVTRTDLFRDTILEDGNYDPKKILNVWPKLKPSNVKYIPIYKYLREAKYLSDEGTLLHDVEVDQSILSYVNDTDIKNFYPTDQHMRKMEEIQQTKGVSGLIKSYDIEHTICYIPLLREEDILTDELREFLKDNIRYIQYVEDANNTYTTSFRKIVCLYDWLHFGLNR